MTATQLTRNSPKALQWLAEVTSPLLQSPLIGALATLRAARDPSAVGGQYYGPGGVGELMGHPVAGVSVLQRDYAPQSGKAGRGENSCGWAHE